MIARRAVPSALGLLVALSLATACGPESSENGQGEIEDPPVDLELSEVVPGEGPASGGTQVRLEGSGFLDGVAETPASASLYTTVRFGGSMAGSPQVVSDTVITVVAPAGQPGDVDVVVSNSNGESVCAACFVYQEEDEGPDRPGVEVTIGGLSPGRGPVTGGTRIAIEGKGFLAGATFDEARDSTEVVFGGNSAVDVFVVDDRRLEVVTPPGNAGARDVEVRNHNGSVSCEGCFEYFAPVRAVSVSPGESPASGGARVTLEGQGFTPESMVRVGGRTAIATEVLDTETISFVTPAGPPGNADVTVLNTQGQSTLRRELVYYEEPWLAEASPSVGSHLGGFEVRLTGRGLSGAKQVTFGGAPATDVRESGGDLLVTAPPGEAGRAVDIVVSHPREEAALARGFAYVDVGRRDVTLVNVTPRHGSTEGGEVVLVAGTGLDHSAAQVRFGEESAGLVEPMSALELRVEVPPSLVEGWVDLQLRNERGGAALEGAFEYERPLRLESVSPEAGPAGGGTEITLLGQGFDDHVIVRIGPLAATEIAVSGDGTRLTAVTPPGSGGAADVSVEPADGGRRGRVTLQAAFTYVEPLRLVRVDPPRGAQSGGTRATLFGSGFAAAESVTFGDREAEILSRVDGMLLVRTPPGDPGSVDVTVSDGESAPALDGAFRYYDPTNPRGGASGGPMLGALNVTVLDSYFGSPLEGALVLVEAESDRVLEAVADERGQVTLSEPWLVKPVRVSAWMPGFEALTVAGIDARDLTMFLTPAGFANGNDDPTPPSPPPVPSPPVVMVNAGPDPGRVCGFKLPPDRVLAPNQREEAWIWTTAGSISGLPPMGWRGQPRKVSRDCGTFGLAARAGTIALYAKYGIVTEEQDEISGSVVETFEPLLMGVTRGIEVPLVDPPTCTLNRACPSGFVCEGREDLDPEDPGAFRWCLCESDDACGDGMICNGTGACQPPVNADIVLNMHMDLEVPVRLVDGPRPPSGGPRLDATYVYLELGGDGVAFIKEAVGVDEDEFTIEGLPRLPGEGFVFMHMSTADGGYPLSAYYRRQTGELESGLEIGPMQPMTRLRSPAQGTLHGPRIQWSYDGGREPDVVRVRISEVGFFPMPVWQIIVPGGVTSIDIPAPVMDLLTAGTSLEISIITALSPRFDFDYFSWRHLGLGSWTSWTQDVQYFSVAQ